MFCDVLKVNKSIERGFRAIGVHLVHQKIDINTIVSEIATPVKPRKKAHVLASVNYYGI